MYSEDARCGQKGQRAEQNMCMTRRIFRGSLLHAVREPLCYIQTSVRSCEGSGRGTMEGKRMARRDLAKPSRLSVSLHMALQMLEKMSYINLWVSTTSPYIVAACMR
jgi:hypothetical protein